MRAPPRPFSGRERGLIFAVCFTAVLLSNLPSIAMPPVWDAVGVFAPAIFLYENGFDLPTLLASPGYLAGGPNIHSLSGVTFATLAAIALTGGDPALYLPLLHVLNFGLAALVIGGTFTLARHFAATTTAGLVALALLMVPLFLVQTGMLHTEIAGAAFVFAAVIAFAHRRLVWMTTLVTAACLVKSFGIALAVGLGALLLCDRELSLSRRLRWLAALAAPAAVIESARWATSPIVSGSTRTLEKHLERMIENLLLVPDIAVLCTLTIGAAAAFAARTARAGVHTALRDGGGRVESACLSIPVAMFAFIAAAPASGASLLPLPRYYVWVLAPMLIAVLAAIARHAGPRSLAVAVAVFAVFLAINREGHLYPDSGEKTVNFSIAERSLAYRDFYAIQRDGIDGVVEFSEDRPVFVTRGEYYYLSSPRMGWIEREIPEVHFVLQPPYAHARLADYPPDFFVLDSSSNYYHGQGTIENLLKRARRHPAWDARIAARWQRGPYRAELHRVLRVGRKRSSAD